MYGKLLLHLLKHSFGAAVGATVASLVFAFLSGSLFPPYAVVQILLAAKAAALLGGLIGFYIDAHINITPSLIDRLLKTRVIGTIAALKLRPQAYEGSNLWLIDNIVRRIIIDLPEAYLKDNSNIDRVFQALNSCLLNWHGGDISILTKVKFWLFPSSKRALIHKIIECFQSSHVYQTARATLEREIEALVTESTSPALEAEEVLSALPESSAERLDPQRTQTRRNMQEKHPHTFEP